ncbi:MAG: HDOD domain-containing protein [Phycisphaerae bacterium]|nr:HDOD domain-containing protein [Phycisphaerae bacterium]
MGVDVVSESKTVVAKALASVGDIATLPEVTVKIIETVEDARSTARDLHDIIKRDPALSAKVLKVVNSSFYGLPGQIAGIDRAIVLLGLSAVKNLAIAASIARLFKGGQISEHFDPRELWRHSVAVGLASRLLGKAGGEILNLDELFVAGLIHDLGVLIERQAFPEKLGEVCDRCAAGEGTFLDLETRIVGADHQQFGEALTTKWRFPRHLRAVIGFHHHPENLSAELQKLGNLIHLADMLCCHEELGFCQTAAQEELTEELLEAVGVSVEQLTEIRDQLLEELDDAVSMLTGA